MDHSFSGDRLRLERSLPPKMPSTKEYDISQVEWEGEEAPFPPLLRRRRRRRDKRRRERVEGFPPSHEPISLDDNRSGCGRLFNSIGRRRGTDGDVSPSIPRRNIFGSPTDSVGSWFREECHCDARAHCFVNVVGVICGRWLPG